MNTFKLFVVTKQCFREWKCKIKRQRIDSCISESSLPYGYSRGWPHK